MKILSAYYSDIGISKKVNQDSLLIKQADTPLGKVLFAVLCDGMGGLKKGEVASASAIEGCAGWFSDTFPHLLNHFSVQSTVESMKELFEVINERIYSYGSRNDIELGTTLTAFLLVGTEVFIIGHIGDSRVYRIKHRVSQLTEDHTFVEREVKNGRLTRQEAENDHRRNILLQCLGAGGKINPQFLSGKPERNCTYMLCSDGFRHEISENEIHGALYPGKLKDEETIRKKAVELVELNKQRMEKDNISTIIICIK